MAGMRRAAWQSGGPAAAQGASLRGGMRRSGAIAKAHTLCVMAGPLLAAAKEAAATSSRAVAKRSRAIGRSRQGGGGARAAAGRPVGWRIARVEPFPLHVRCPWALFPASDPRVDLAVCWLTEGVEGRLRQPKDVGLS